MVRFNMKREGLFRVTSDSDKVIAGVPIPPGGAVLQVQGHVDVMTDVCVAIDAEVRYALNAYVIPMTDFDSSVDVNTLWDNIVPKDDAATGDIEANESSADGDPEYEPGSPDLETIVGIHGTPLVPVFRRERAMTYASHPMFAHLDTTNFFWPAERIPVSISKKVRVDQPSMLLWGFSSPLLDITTTSSLVTPTLQEWGRMQFMKDALTDMMKNALQLVEAGSETPYEEAQAHIVKLLEKVVIEEAGVAAHLTAVAFNVYSSMNFKVDMPEQGVNLELTGG